MIVYIDTSAALKLVIEEPESPQLAQAVQDHMDSQSLLVSSFLPFTQMHCGAGLRRGINSASVANSLDSFNRVDLQREDLLTAGTAGWGLRSADAIHLASALRVGSAVMITYDEELRTAAARAGLSVESPGP